MQSYKSLVKLPDCLGTQAVFFAWTLLLPSLEFHTWRALLHTQVMWNSPFQGWIYQWPLARAQTSSKATMVCYCLEDSMGSDSLLAIVHALGILCNGKPPVKWSAFVGTSTKLLFCLQSPHTIPFWVYMNVDWKKHSHGNKLLTSPT